MAAKGHDRFGPHFEDIFSNIDVKLITPFLTTLGLILVEDETKLEEKSRKSVKFMLRKVRGHDKGDDLFKDCLIKTSGSSQGHQKLLKILYDPKDSSSGNFTIHILISS